MQAVKFVLATFCLIFMLSSHGPAAAQDWPKQPVRIVVPQPAGGAADTMARKLGDKLSEKWKQPVLIDNKPGGSQAIGAIHVISSKSDGYTLFLPDEIGMETNAFLFAKPPYNPAKDLTPITRLISGPFMYTVRSDSPYRTMQQLVAAAKATPDKVSYGSGGIGGGVHLTVNWFGLMAGNVQFKHIPYRGSAPAVQDLLAGVVDFVAMPLSPVAPFVKDNRARILATSSPARLASLPDVPTLTELGYKDSVADFQLVLAGPGGMRPEISNLIARDVALVLKDSKFVAENVEPFGFIALGDTPDEFARFLAVDREKQKARVKAANVQLD